MNKVFKKILYIIFILFFVSILFRTIDVKMIRDDKKPIFCIDRSGGSIIYYIGFGYNIEGAWDDIPGGLKNANAYSWFDCLINNGRY